MGLKHTHTHRQSTETFSLFPFHCLTLSFSFIHWCKEVGRGSLSLMFDHMFHGFSRTTTRTQEEEEEEEADDE